MTGPPLAGLQIIARHEALARRPAHHDHHEPVGAGGRHARVAGVHPEPPARDKLDVLAVDPHRSGSGEDDVHLLLAALGLVVLAPGRTGRELELVDAEAARAQRDSHLAKDAEARLDVVGVDHRMAHRTAPFVIGTRRGWRTRSGAGCAGRGSRSWGSGRTLPSTAECRAVGAGRARPCRRETSAGRPPSGSAGAGATM